MSRKLSCLALLAAALMLLLAVAAPLAIAEPSVTLPIIVSCPDYTVNCGISTFPNSAAGRLARVTYFGPDHYFAVSYAGSWDWRWSLSKQNWGKSRWCAVFEDVPYGPARIEYILENGQSTNIYITYYPVEPHNTNDWSVKVSGDGAYYTATMSVWWRWH